MNFTKNLLKLKPVFASLHWYSKNGFFTTQKPGFGGPNFVELSMFSGRRKTGVHALVITRCEMAVESLLGQGRSNGEEIDVGPAEIAGCEKGKKPSSNSPTTTKAVESAGLGL